MSAPYAGTVTTPSPPLPGRTAHFGVFILTATAQAAAAVAVIGAVAGVTATVLTVIYATWFVIAAYLSHYCLGGWTRTRRSVPEWMLVIAIHVLVASAAVPMVTAASAGSIRAFFDAWPPVLGIEGIAALSIAAAVAIAAERAPGGAQHPRARRDTAGAIRGSR